jgi:hypothetical protein
MFFYIEYMYSPITLEEYRRIFAPRGGIVVWKTSGNLKVILRLPGLTCSSSSTQPSIVSQGPGQIFESPITVLDDQETITFTDTLQRVFRMYYDPEPGRPRQYLKMMITCMQQNGVPDSQFLYWILGENQIHRKLKAPP